ncbi:MAG: hypothetical protein DI560_27185 [Pseudomonas putida]|nr:MAG: hypothetical protein DI560_27185 [Pseudomonas putida]
MTLMRRRATSALPPRRRHTGVAYCSGLMIPDTHLGENARHREVSDDQATSYLYPRIQARSCQPGARPGL